MIAEASLPYFVKATGDERLAFYIDNHLISTHGYCERKFYLQHIQRLRLKGPSGLAMSIGGWWSAVLEDFYNMMRDAQMAPAPGPCSACTAGDHMMQNHTHAHYAKYPTQNDFIEHAGKRWREAKMDLVEQSKPKAYKEFGGAKGAALMAMQYYQEQGKLDFQNWKIVGAEQGFGQRGEVLLHEDSKIVIYYMGKPDLVVLSDGGKTLLPVEHKTIHRIDRRIQTKYKPHPQIAGYVFALNRIARNLGYDRPVDRCIVNVCGRALPAEKPKDGIKKPRFTRVFPSYSVEELEEWRLNVVNKVMRLHFCLINDIWNWNEGPFTCHMYGGCEYRGIDSKPPSVRPLVIQSDFVTVEAWTPYVMEDEEEDGE
jgi:hypothetical protein